MQAHSKGSGILGLMAVAAFVVSVLALIASTGAVVYTRRAAITADSQAAEARRQADAAHEELRMAATPQLMVVLLDDSATTGPDVLYEIRNDGPRVRTLHRVRPRNRFPSIMSTWFENDRRPPHRTRYMPRYEIACARPGWVLAHGRMTTQTEPSSR